MIKPNKNNEKTTYTSRFKRFLIITGLIILLLFIGRLVLADDPYNSFNFDCCPVGRLDTCICDTGWANAYKAYEFEIKDINGNKVLTRRDDKHGGDFASNIDFNNFAYDDNGWFSYEFYIPGEIKNDGVYESTEFWVDENNYGHGNISLGYKVNNRYYEPTDRIIISVGNFAITLPENIGFNETHKIVAEFEYVSGSIGNLLYKVRYWSPDFIGFSDPNINSATGWSIWFSKTNSGSYNTNTDFRVFGKRWNSYSDVFCYFDSFETGYGSYDTGIEISPVVSFSSPADNSEIDYIPLEIGSSWDNWDLEDFNYLGLIGYNSETSKTFSDWTYIDETSGSVIFEIDEILDIGDWIFNFKIAKFISPTGSWTEYETENKEILNLKILIDFPEKTFPTIPVISGESDLQDPDDFYAENSDYTTSTALFNTLTGTFGSALNYIDNFLDIFDYFEMNKDQAGVMFGTSIRNGRSYLQNINAFFNDFPITEILSLYLLSLMIIVIFRIIKFIRILLPF